MLLIILLVLRVYCYNTTNCTHGGTEVIPGMCVCKPGFDNSTHCERPTCGISDWDEELNKCKCKAGFGGPNCNLPFCSLSGCLQLYGPGRAHCSRYLFLYSGGGMSCEITRSFVSGESFFVLSELFPAVTTEVYQSFGAIFGQEFSLQCYGFGADTASSNDFYYYTDEINGGTCEIQFYDYWYKTRFETLWFSLEDCHSKFDKLDGHTYYKCLTVKFAECQPSSYSSRCHSPALKEFLNQIHTDVNAIATLECDTQKRCDFDIVGHFPYKIEMNRCFGSSCVAESQFLDGLDALVRENIYHAPADVRLILKIVFICLGGAFLFLFSCCCLCCLVGVEGSMRLMIHVEFAEYKRRYRDIKTLEVNFENMRYFTLKKRTDKIWIQQKEILKGLKSHFATQELVAIVGHEDSGRDEFLYLMSKQRMSELIPGQYDIDMYLSHGNEEPQMVRRTALLRMSGFMAREGHLDPSLTARENLRFSLELKIPTTYEMVFRHRKISKIIDMLDLTKQNENDSEDEEAENSEDEAEEESRADVLVSELTAVERRLVSIGTQLVHDPYILFLEDPIHSLPVRDQMRVMKLLRHLVQEEGISIFMTVGGPVPNNVFFEMDQLVFLHEGEIVFQGPVGQVPQFFGGYYSWEKENNLFYGLMDLIKVCNKETLKAFHQIAKTKLAVRKIEKRMSMSMPEPIQIDEDRGIGGYGTEKGIIDTQEEEAKDDRQSVQIEDLKEEGEESDGWDDEEEVGDNDVDSIRHGRLDSFALSEISDLGSLNEGSDIQSIDFQKYAEEINTPPPPPPRNRTVVEEEENENTPPPPPPRNRTVVEEEENENTPPPPPPRNRDLQNEDDEEDSKGRKTPPPPPPRNRDELEEGGGEVEEEEEEDTTDDDDDFKLVIPRFNENVSDDDDDEQEGQVEDEESSEDSTTVIKNGSEEEEEEEGEGEDSDDDDDDDKPEIDSDDDEEDEEEESKKQQFSTGFRKDVLKSLNLGGTTTVSVSEKQEWEKLFLRTATPHFHQLFTLFMRQLLKYIRDRSLIPLQCTFSLIFSFLIGYMYYKQKDTEEGLTNKVNGMFLLFCFYSVLSIFRYKEWVREKRVYRAEMMDNGYYYFWVYYVHKMCFDIFPLRFMTQLIGTWTIYFTIGLRPTFEYFFYFWLIFTMVGLINDIWVYNVAMIFGDGSFIGQSLIIFYFLWNVMFGGILIDRASTNFWNACSVWFWGLKILVINELSLVSKEPGTEYMIPQIFPQTIYLPTMGKIILDNRWGYQDLETGVDLAFLCLVLIFFFVLMFTFWMLCCLTMKPYCCIINRSYIRWLFRFSKESYEKVKEKVFNKNEEEEEE